MTRRRGPRWNRGGYVRTDRHLGAVPLRVWVGGRDAPLSPLARAIWRAVLVFLVATVVGIIAVLAGR